MHPEYIILKRIVKRGDQELMLAVNYEFLVDCKEIYKQIKVLYEETGKIPSVGIISSYEDIIPNFSGVSIHDVMAVDDDEETSDEELLHLLESLYIQDYALDLIAGFVSKINKTKSHEVATSLHDLAMNVAEKIKYEKNEFTIRDVISNTDDANEYVSLGFNKEFDEEYKAGLTEFVLIGGKQGSGKSIVAANIALHQWEKGLSTILFSLEVRKKEVFDRLFAMKSGIPAMDIRLGCLSEIQEKKVLLSSAEFFKNKDEIIELISNGEYKKARELMSISELTDNQLIVVDDPNLTIQDIEKCISSYKQKFNENLKVIIVDYMNQVVTSDMYSWESQLEIAKSLKNLARKYDVCIVSPYQINDEGKARLSRAILDPPDFAIVIEQDGDSIIFKSKKTRNTAPFELTTKIDWASNRLLLESPTDVLNEDSIFGDIDD